MPLEKSEQYNLVQWTQKHSSFFESFDLQWHTSTATTWFRYSLVASPRLEVPQATVTGLFFDRQDPSQNCLLQQTVPIQETRIERELFYFSIGPSAIYQEGTRGHLSSDKNQMRWEVKLKGPSPFLEYFPSAVYRSPFPAFKRVSPFLSGRIEGEFFLNNKSILLKNVPACQSHVWGTHIPLPQIWAHAHSFVEDPSGVFEGWFSKTPLFFLCFKGKPYSFLSPLHWFQNKSFYENNRWHFEAKKGDRLFVGDLLTTPESMIASQERAPNGEAYQVKRTALANLRIEIFEKKGRNWSLAETLTTDGSTVFEAISAFG